MTRPPDPDDDTTTQDRHPSSNGVAGTDPRRGLTLTILWHPDPARIGAISTPNTARGAAVDLSRRSPLFRDGLPLDDAGVSRTPLQLVPEPAGGVRVWPGRADLHYTLDGVPGVGGDSLSVGDLDRGLVLGLGRHGPLVLVRTGLVSAAHEGHGLVGSSPALCQVRETIERLAPHDCSVLITGPTGSGKELVAEALHRGSRRARRPFLAVNMAGLSEGTIQSQLFGHQRGSFTGADRTGRGLFGRADGGTLFLDEIGACPQDIQALLLRALESGEVQPVGGEPRKVDVRVLAATDEDLDQAVASGAFRRALYHRLCHGMIRLPPLAGRPADVAAQAVHFIDEAFGRSSHPGKQDLTGSWLHRNVILQLLVRRWPGNSRELRNVAEQLVILHGHQRRCGPVPDPAEGPPLLEPGVAAAPREAPIDPVGAGDDLALALRRHAYRIDAAARELGLSRNTVRRRMHALGMPRPKELTEDQIRAALSEAGGSLERAALDLHVSKPGLRLRCGELGIHEDDWG